MSQTQALLNQLDITTAHLSVDQLLSELQIVVERMSFSGLNESQQWEDPNLLTAQIGILFEGEISTEMLDYIQWLREKSLLGIVMGSNGILFLNYCIKKYKNLPQIKFITPLPASLSLREYIRQRILPAYPAGARLVFVTKPSLVAGFVIDDGVRSIDRSLRYVVSQRLKSNVEYLNAGLLHG